MGQSIGASGRREPVRDRPLGRSGPSPATPAAEEIELAAEAEAGPHLRLRIEPLQLQSWTSIFIVLGRNSRLLTSPSPLGHHHLGPAPSRGTNTSRHHHVCSSPFRAVISLGTVIGSRCPQHGGSAPGPLSQASKASVCAPHIRVVGGMWSLMSASCCLWGADLPSGSRMRRPTSSSMGARAPPLHRSPSGYMSASSFSSLSLQQKPTSCTIANKGSFGLPPQAWPITTLCWHRLGPSPSRATIILAHYHKLSELSRMTAIILGHPHVRQ